MRSGPQLKAALDRIDGKGYKAYKSIEGGYVFDRFELFIDHVQGDPFAEPSRLRVRVTRTNAGFPDDTTRNASRRIALCDFLIRHFYAQCRRIARPNRGSGKSGLITIDTPVQEILPRSAMTITANDVQTCFFMGLPARGRRIAGRDAVRMLLDELPRIVTGSLFMAALDAERLYRHIKIAEDADFLRDALPAMGLVAFVADGAHLPRLSGIDARPLPAGETIAFKAPAGMQVQVTLPNSGTIQGLGVPEGVTLIVGGGYHGKSTLLNALELGVYNHVPGDGRELVVSHPAAVKIRAYDGRSIAGTDISPFINNLPFGKDTQFFTTQNASGSTSQAASISEMVEVGAKVLLLDEDTSATNFMIRDHRMQRLVVKGQEPITPYIDKVRQLYQDHGISTILVMGGSGDYFGTADQVIRMSAYLPEDVTTEAREIAATIKTGRADEGGANFGSIRPRIPLVDSFDPYQRPGRMKITAPRTLEIMFGRTPIDLGDLEQVVTISQTRAIGHAIWHATRYMRAGSSLKAVVDQVMQDLEREGLDVLPPYRIGNLAGFRGLELAAAINRLRSLKVKG